MSDIYNGRMIPLHIADQAVAACEAEIEKLKHERIHDLNQIGGLQEENARLKAEVERLRTAGDTLVAAYCMGDRNKERWAEYPVVREWLAARGELP